MSAITSTSSNTKALNECVSAAVSRFIASASDSDRALLLQVVNYNWTSILCEAQRRVEAWDMIRSSNPLLFFIDDLTATWLITVMPYSASELTRLYEHYAHGLTWLNRSRNTDEVASERCITQSKLSAMFETDPWLLTLMAVRIALMAKGEA